MAVPTVITDLSATAASNSPSGADSPTDGDNFIRALSAFIRQNYDDITAAAADLVDATDTAKGDALIGVKRTATGAIATTQHAWHEAQVLNVVTDFGATGNGTTDDTTAIQAAVDAIADTGGSVYFPTGRYKVTSQIDIQSTRPIHLIGDMGGQIYNPSVTPAGIIIGGNITGSIIKFSSPATRAEHGGGSIIGLSFYDATGSGATPGTYTCTAALELYDFSLSTVKDCSFHWINGSAILGEFTVMSSFINNHIRYCGASSKPAVLFPSTSGSFPCQSSVFDGNHIEVCRGAAYFVIGANSSDCKIVANGFEADTGVSATNEQFLTIAGTAHQVIGNHFNRNTGTQVTISCQSSSITGNAFRGGAYATTSVAVSGSRNAIVGNTFESTRTKYEIDISGPYNTFTGNVMYSSGALRVQSVGNSVTSNVLNFCTATTANLGAGDDWWIQEISGATTTSTVISNNVLSNNGGGVTTTGGIRVNGTTPIVSGNSFNAFNGSGNGAICVRTETGNGTIYGNTEANSTTLVSASGNPGVLYGNNPVSAGAMPLRNSATYDPPSLADGEGVTQGISCAGAVLGDIAVATFSLDLQGISLTAWVSAADSVGVRFQNETGGAINLGSGTLYVRVLR